MWAGEAGTLARWQGGGWTGLWPEAPAPPVLTWEPWSGS